MMIGCKQLEKDYAEGADNEEDEDDELTIDESDNFDDEDESGFETPSSAFSFY
jgi:hypothetical protein